MDKREDVEATVHSLDEHRSASKLGGLMRMANSRPMIYGRFGELAVCTCLLPDGSPGVALLHAEVGRPIGMSVADAWNLAALLIEQTVLSNKKHRGEPVP